MPLTWIKALAQLGFRQTSLYALYQMELKSGYLRWKTKVPFPSTTTSFQYSIPLPEPEQLRLVLGPIGLDLLFAEADEIVSGKVRLFGGEPVELVLIPPVPLKHWTLYRRMQLGDDQDIKFIWEPGRFCWVTTLARAYFLSRDERYAGAFWKYIEIFLDNNPAYLGVHWISAQEVALRLTSIVFAFQLFATSPHSSPGRISRLAESIAQHARRIPPSLSYARAQNNNHLLTEAMGLMTAASVLPAHPSAKKWQALGWEWFHKGLQAQIAVDGSYNQHSTNYHRLMLQTALWVRLLGKVSGISFPKLSLDRLAAATNWLRRLLDDTSGHVPNLGPNDGAYIFPLSVLPFQDFRPLIQAAGEAFLGKKILPTGVWDEMGLWLCNEKEAINYGKSQQNEDDLKKVPNYFSPAPYVLNSSLNSWAYLRAAHFSSRPGHADQLHLDLWWRGFNLSLDPGTYLYNAPAPWDNALTSTFVHNTVAINEHEQMTRAGRFLYLDWARADVRSQDYAQDGEVTRVTATHNGYQRLGVVHQRSVEACSAGWKIEDQLLPVNEKRPISVQARLHWLVPDWEWLLEPGEKEVVLKLHSPMGWISTQISARNSAGNFISASDLSIVLIRAGQVLDVQGQAEPPLNPTWGWFSPTYGAKIPALSFSIQVSGLLPITFYTNWNLHTE